MYNAKHLRLHGVHYKMLSIVHNSVVFSAFIIYAFHSH